MGRRFELRERDFEGFFRAPFEAYPEDSPFVSPLAGDLRKMLDPGRNPFYGAPGDGTFFTLHRSGTPVGRVSAHVHHDANRRFGLARGYFGFLDVVDDPAAGRILLEAAEEWARARGCLEIAGNFDLTAVQEMGVMTRGHDRAPYTAMQWNPPHLGPMLEAAGYEPFFPMRTWELELAGFDPGSLVGPKQRQLIASEPLRWTRLGRWTFRRRSEDVRRLLNVSFASNPHFVPVSKAEFDFQAGPLSWVVDRRLSLLVDRAGRAAGVLVCIPDLNPLLRRIGSRLGPGTPIRYLRYRRNARRAVIVFSGVVPGMQGGGLGAVMLSRAIRALKHAGYTHLGITWVSTRNRPSLRLLDKLGASPLHELALYRKSLEH